MCSMRSVGDTIQRNVMQCSWPFTLHDVLIRAFPCYCDVSLTTLMYSSQDQTETWENTGVFSSHSASKTGSGRFKQAQYDVSSD